MMDFNSSQLKSMKLKTTDVRFEHLELFPPKVQPDLQMFSLKCNYEQQIISLEI